MLVLVGIGVGLVLLAGLGFVVAVPVRVRRRSKPEETVSREDRYEALMEARRQLRAALGREPSAVEIYEAAAGGGRRR